MSIAAMCVKNVRRRVNSFGTLCLPRWSLRLRHALLVSLAVLSLTVISLTSITWETSTQAKLKRYSLFSEKTDGEGQLASTWYQENAEPAYTCVREERIGPQGDGGKWMCDPYGLRKERECLVYSFGSNNDFRWESTVQKIAKNCEIHVFDHTVEQSKAPHGIHFHGYGLTSYESGTLKTLRTIVSELNHEGRTLDVLKVDCEGCEWSTFREWLTSAVYINEVLVELHAGTQEPHTNPFARQFMLEMYKNKMLIFHKEPNIRWSQGNKLCVEYSLKRMRGWGSV